MYIAGLKVSFPPPQWLEVAVVLSTAEHFRHFFTQLKRIAPIAESNGGKIRPGSMPSTLLGRLITPIHGLAIVVPPLIYIGALVLNRFQPPEWMTNFAFSTEIMESSWKNALRIAACVASSALARLTDSVFEHLGDQWHFIGRREKPRIVTTGPYAWVRHPLYTTVLLQQTLWSIMFWSYIPLGALGITALAFAVKMPIEESLIQKDEAIRNPYQQYMRDVPARILPYVW